MIISCVSNRSVKCQDEYNSNEIKKRLLQIYNNNGNENKTVDSHISFTMTIRQWLLFVY